MSGPDPLDDLRRRLMQAAASLEALAAFDGLARAHGVIEQTLPAERRPLLDLIRGEIEVCRLRREHSVWTAGSRMYVNRGARIFARRGTDPGHADTLRESATRGTIESVHTLTSGLSADPTASPALLQAACAGLLPHERAATPAVGRELLALIAELEHDPPAKVQPVGGR